MRIMLNGEPTEIGAGSNVVALLEQIGLADQRVAVEINREIVPRSTYADVPLNSGDEVEIVRAIGGG